MKAMEIRIDPVGNGEWEGGLVCDDGGGTLELCPCSGPSREAVRIAVFQEAARLLGEALLDA